MSKTLYILRHAKAVPQTTEMDDHERPLSARGERDAQKMGSFMLQSNIIPPLVLCSTAMRTRQTLNLLERGLDQPLSVHFSTKLYLASPHEVMEELTAIPGNPKTVMVIGHNPTLHQLCVDLAESGDDRLMDELSQHFPTTALAEISYPANEWSELGAKKGVLKRFVTPASLVSA